MSAISTVKSRQIVLDTETTGMNKFGLHYEGHRIIEIGAVEVVNRRLTGKNFHVYIKPDRQVDPKAYDIHGISDKFLADKPVFADIATQFLVFIRGAELVIHNAVFDIGFMDQELRLLNQDMPKIETFCSIIDSLLLARRLFPGKRNSLDALCDRYDIDNSKRTLHGALLDAEILAEVYLAMTGGQTSLTFSMEDTAKQDEFGDVQHIVCSAPLLKIGYASDEEIAAHEARLDVIEKIGHRDCLWRSLNKINNSDGQ